MFYEAFFPYKSFRSAHDPEASWWPCGCQNCRSRDRVRWERQKARGQVVQEITCADGCTLARFEWGSVALPEELEPRLSGLVGRTVAVLRAECYHVRLVE